MSKRAIVLELPELNYIQVPDLTVMGGSQSLPQMLLELGERHAQEYGRSKVVPTLREAARLLEALRLALHVGDVEDYERLTDGEIAFVKSNKAIADKLDEMIALMKEDREERKTVGPNG